MTLPRFSFLGSLFRRTPRPFPAARYGAPTRVVVDSERYLALVQAQSDRIKHVDMLPPDIERGTFARFVVEMEPAAK